MKRTNKASERHVAEPAEERGSSKGNTPKTPGPRTQCRLSPTDGLRRVRAAASRDKGAQFTALLHHVTVDLLRASYLGLNRKAAPGIDDVTWAEYGEDLEARLSDLHGRLHRGSYRTRPSKRARIAKEDGSERQLGIATLNDKVAQAATTTVLQEIYEADFMGFSYGFRPKRSQHDALDALWVGLTQRRVNWVLDADIRGFFDAINHEWLLKFLEHRIGDRRVLRLIRKWLKAGYLEGTEWTTQETGAPQGSVISPFLGNVYLHYAFDLWVHQWRSRYATGDVIVVRYADDIVMGFQHQGEAQRFLRELKERLASFDLELHPEKTRLIEFGRFAAERREGRGLGRPETFDFLGFTHICSEDRRGKFKVLRRPMAKRVRRTLKAVRQGLRRRMHERKAQQGRWLASVYRGWLNYYAVPDTYPVLARFRGELTRMWLRTLQRRSQKARRTWNWSRMGRLASVWLPRPTIRHPYPDRRLCVSTRGGSRMQ